MMPYDPTKTIAVNEAYFAARSDNQDQRIAALKDAATAQPPAAFTMQQLAIPNHIYPRDGTAGSPQMVGTIPVTMTVTTAGTVYARTRAVTSGNPVLSPPRKVLDSVATGTRAVAITGLPAIEDEFFLDLSPDGVTWQFGTVPVGIGLQVGYLGQSLMVTNFSRRTEGDTMAGAGETPTTAGRVLSEGGAWQAFTDSDAQGVVNGAGANALIRLLAAKHKCRVGLVGYAAGATPIEYWTPGNEGWDKFMASITKAGSRIEACIWMQGHSDSSTFDRTSAYYRKQLSAIFTALDAAVTDTSFTRYIATIPNISSTSWGEPFKKEAIRVAGQRWCEENPRAVSVVMDDLTLHDGVHQDQAGSVRTAVNFYRHMVNPATAVGATIGGVTRAGATLSVPLTLPAGATGFAFTGDLKTRLMVQPRGLRDPGQAYTIASVALGAANGGVVPLNIMLATVPDEQDIDVIFAPKNDPSDDGGAVVLRNDLVGDGANYGRQVTAARPARYAAARPVTLNNGPAYSAGRWAGRQGLSAGAGTPGLVLASWSDGYTIEAWVRHNGAAGTNVFLHAGGAYYAFGGDDFNINGGSRAGLLPRDTWHHVAITNDAGGSRIHVGGLLVAESGPGGNFPPSQLPGIRGFFDGGFRPAPDTCTISDVAVWDQSRYGPDAFAVPTGPYTGSEAHLDHLWTLNGNGLDSRVR